MPLQPLCVGFQTHFLGFGCNEPCAVPEHADSQRRKDFVAVAFVGRARDSPELSTPHPCGVCPGRHSDVGAWLPELALRCVDNITLLGKLKIPMMDYNCVQSTKAISNFWTLTVSQPCGKPVGSGVRNIFDRSQDVFDEDSDTSDLVTQVIAAFSTRLHYQHALNELMLEVCSSMI